MTALQDLFVESGLDPDAMVDVVDALAPLTDRVDEAPTPSPELAVLFAARPADGRAPRALGQRTSALAGVLVLAFSSVGATGLSAAANTLPRPLQHQVSEFSRHFLPFDLPEPPGRPERAPLSSTPDVDGARAFSEVGEMSRSQPQRPEILVATGKGPGPVTGQSGHPSGGAQPAVRPRHDPGDVAGPGSQPTTTAAPKPAHPGASSADKGAVTGQEASGKPAGQGQGQGKDQGNGQGASATEQAGTDDAGSTKAPGKGQGKGQGQTTEPGKGPDNGKADPAPSSHAPGPTSPAPSPTTPQPDPGPIVPLPSPLPGGDVPGGSVLGGP